MKSVRSFTAIEFFAVTAHLGISFLAISQLGFLSFTSPHCLAATTNEIRILSINGVINPLSARYLKRELTHATQEKAHAVILELNTPGGLESSMREMTQSMLNATLPVIVYVTPSGARAASAGMLITIAANVAVMAPGTNIGAAHPVGIGGDSGDQKINEVMKEKIVSDAAAFARAIAKQRNRNMNWVESAVRKSTSIAAHEALEANVIDLIASDLNDLLTQLNERKVRLPLGNATLITKDIRLARRPMRLPEKLLQVITDPNIAYLLITIGFIGIVAELYSPGLFIPGITGAISLLLGFTALGSLPIGWAGVVFLMLGIGLLFLELQDPGFGFFGIAGLVAFILGSLLLYTPIGPVSPALPNVRVSPWVIGAVTFGIVAFFTLALKAVLSARQLPVATGRSTLIGKRAVAVTDLSPKGVVQLNHERWSALAQTEMKAIPIHAGEVVEVIDVEGAILKVQRPTKENQKEPKKLRQTRKL